MQSWAWSIFKESDGQKILRLGIFDDQKLCAGTIVYYVPSSLGASALELPHGPVLPWHDEKKSSAAMKMIRAELEKIAQDVQSPLARLEPFMTSPLPSYMGKTIRAPLDLIPTPTLLISLNHSDEKILAGMTAKGRYNVRLAQKKGVDVFCSPTEEAIHDFYRLFELTFTRHNFSGEPQTFFEKMRLALQSRNMIKIYFARYRGMLLAAAIVIFYGERATYLYGGSLPFFSSAMAAYALHWQMMQDAREAGCQKYDFYGIAPEGQPFHPYAKFSQFKLRFGGERINTIGAQDIYFYPQLANMWIKSLENINTKEVSYGQSAH